MLGCLGVHHGVLWLASLWFELACRCEEGTSFEAVNKIKEANKPAHWGSLPLWEGYLLCLSPLVEYMGRLVTLLLFGAVLSGYRTIEHWYSIGIAIGG